MVRTDLTKMAIPYIKGALGIDRQRMAVRIMSAALDAEDFAMRAASSMSPFGHALLLHRCEARSDGQWPGRGFAEGGGLCNVDHRVVLATRLARTKERHQADRDIQLKQTPRWLKSLP